MNPLSIKILLWSFILLNVMSACGPNAPQENKKEAIQLTGDAGIDALSQELKVHPDDASLWAKRADLFYENEAYDEAIGDLSQALLLDSMNAEYHHLLADVYLDYYQSRMAMRTMERAVAIHPTHIPTLLKMSEIYFILQMYEKSIKTANDILKIDPQNADAFFLIAMNFKDMGEEEKAIVNYQKVVEYNADFTDAWISLGQLYAERSPEKALNFFNTAISIDKDDLNPLHAKADFLWAQGQLEEALATYKEITLKDTQYAPAYFNAALVSMDMDSLGKAKQFFDMAIGVDPVYVKAYYFRGLNYEMQGNKEAAIADYEQALALAPDLTEAQEHLDKLKSVQ